jgi:UDP-sugar pyrophosphorylase
MNIDKIFSGFLPSPSQDKNKIESFFSSLKKMEELPENLRANVSILSEQEKEVASRLIALGQHHLFASWEPPGVNDESKHVMMMQVQDLDKTCHDGLEGYIKRARKLLDASRAGTNPFDGWKPSVPSGVSLTPFTPEYAHYEKQGMTEVGKCGFVLVAGGLGERLGYSGIKIELPVETVTRTCYLQHYAEQILAMQTRYADNTLLPLAIMVSDDTLEKTVDLLERNNYFGLDRMQVTLMKQGKVPALISNQAQIAMSGPYELDAKPHGHGDVHSLMYSTGLASDWAELGIKWIIFFQDTNGLAFYSLPAMLGVSVDLNLAVNSLAIPRFAKQSIGAITKLTHDDGREMTINVEYNQLDPMLRAYGSSDDNDPTSGHSPYPGNINQLLFRIEPYLQVLQQSRGLMPEFVNPKYKDATKTVFKKPTRLECMMQDFPRLLDTSQKVGFTMAPAWLCYSPCKNNPTDAAASIASGIPAASPYTAESEQYQVWSQLLRLLGADIMDAEPKTILGITAVPSPRLVFKPSFVLFPHELQARVVNGSNISITSRSSLVIEGDVILDTLALDGALHLAARSNARMFVKVQPSNAVVNRGHELLLLPEEEMNNKDVAEIDRMRGYILQAVEERFFVAENPTVDVPNAEAVTVTTDAVTVVDAVNAPATTTTTTTTTGPAQYVFNGHASILADGSSGGGSDEATVAKSGWLSPCC